MVLCNFSVQVSMFYHNMIYPLGQYLIIDDGNHYMRVTIGSVYQHYPWLGCCINIFSMAAWFYIHVSHSLLKYIFFSVHCRSSYHQFFKCNNYTCPSIRFSYLIACLWISVHLHYQPPFKHSCPSFHYNLKVRNSGCYFILIFLLSIPTWSC